MEMTADYLAKTAEFRGGCGFEHTAEADTSERDGATVFHRTRHQLRRPPDEHLVLEAITYPSGTEAFYLEIVGFHGLRSTSFMLDSWKHFKDRVEFKYYAHPESGMGLSFVLDLEPG